MSITEVNLQDQILSNAFLTDLLAFVEEVELEELNFEETTTGFQITSTDQANYVVKKIKELRQERQNAEETVKREMARYEAKLATWKEKTVKPLDNQEEFLMQALESFAHQKLEDSSKKSLKLIEGTIGFRAQQDKYEYDEKILLDFLKEKRPKFLRYTPAPDKVELKKAGTVKNGKLYLDNEEVAGVIVTPQNPKFEIK